MKTQKVFMEIKKNPGIFPEFSPFLNHLVLLFTLIPAANWPCHPSGYYRSTKDILSASLHPSKILVHVKDSIESFAKYHGNNMLKILLSTRDLRIGKQIFIPYWNKTKVYTPTSLLLRIMLKSFEHVLMEKSTMCEKVCEHTLF